MGPRRLLPFVLILLAGACTTGSGSGDAQRTPEGVTACLEDAGVPVRLSAPPSFNAVVELAVGERDGISVRVLFYEDEGGASGGSNTIRIAGEPVIRVGTVLVILAGPGFEDAEAAVLECLGAEPG